MADTNTGRRPVATMESVHRGKLLASTTKAKRDLDRMRPESGSSLAVARVVNIDYEEFFVTLKTVSGTSEDFIRAPVPMTFPGAGARHFFGSLPMIGDYCIIGWMNQESSRKADRSPVILAWVLPGVFPGRDWLTMGEFEKDEFDIESPKDKALFEGLFSPIRHKLRHIQPGNIVGSSAQGSDLVLDEGVILANRRGNEFRLRDQDQAAVTRALQRFDALAGVRAYHGMVQRDATLLAPYMVSDGYLWDDKQQMLGDEPIPQSDLPVDPTAPKGFLTPAKILRKTPASGTPEKPAGALGRAKLPLDQNLDPYEFLKRGGFINSQGFVVDDKVFPSAIYGGKPIYRVASQTNGNATLDPDARTLTEYRIEVNHTSDGRLPVTEQTDMFDADRLPDKDLSSLKGPQANAPFIEWVLGSVVGNDPFSESGRQKYAVPLRATVFDGDRPAPRLDAISLPKSASDKAVSLEEHAATLLRISPLNGGADTFYSFNKKGQLKASIGGPATENSIEAYLQGGLKLGVGGRFEFLLNGHLGFRTLGKSSLNFTADNGSVVLYGGGPVKNVSSVGERLSGTGGGEADLPAVHIEAKTNALFKAGRKAALTGNLVEIQGSSVRLTGNQEVSIDAVDRIAMGTETLSVTVNGKASESYSGPKNLLPTNGALHERTYTHLFAGTCEEATYTLGSRKETFYLGNHDTTVLVGNLAYRTLAGRYTAQAATSVLEMSVGGIAATAAAGTLALQAIAGSATLLGAASVSVISGGPAQIRGGTSVYLGAPITGTDFGPILCAGSREPFTNLPFATWGIGAKAHLVGP